MEEDMLSSSDCSRWTSYRNVSFSNWIRVLYRKTKLFEVSKVMFLKITCVVQASRNVKTLQDRLTSSYTAFFTSMITSSDTESTCLDIENLKTTNAIIGCDEDSIIFKYLVEVTGFQRKNIRHISLSSIDDYAKALSSESIKAAFFLLPYAEVFLAKYCKDFSASYQIHGLADSLIVFPRGSPFVSAMSEDMLRLRESGELNRMKQKMLSFLDGSRSTIDRTMKRGIGPGPFSGFFILSGGASAIALTITVVRMMKRRWESLIQGILMGRRLWVWLNTLFFRNRRRNELQLSTRISSTSQTLLSIS